MAISKQLITPPYIKTMINPKKVIFLKVDSNNSKLQKLCRTVSKHYNKRERVLITVPTEQAAIYVDQLLWRMPEDSFLPHAIINTLTEEPIAISREKGNINQAKVLINLCPDAAVNAEGFAVVYELLDTSDSDKEALSKKRLARYSSSAIEFV